VVGDDVGHDRRQLVAGEEQLRKDQQTGTLVGGAADQPGSDGDVEAVRQGDPSRRRPCRQQPGLLLEAYRIPMRWSARSWLLSMVRSVGG
jgi:hypothetical protein